MLVVVRQATSVWIKPCSMARATSVCANNLGFRGVRLVAAFLAVKVALAIPARRGRLAAAVFGTKALHAGPRFNQRAVDRKMIVRQQHLDWLLVQHRGHEPLGNVTL